jgi:hypothetical protein
MTNGLDVADESKKLRLCLWILVALGALMALCFWLEILSFKVGMLLTTAHLSAALIVARMLAVSVRRAKAQKSPAEPAEGSRI